MGEVLGKSFRKLLHLRRMSVCRSLILNKKEYGQDFSPGVLGTASSSAAGTSGDCSCLFPPSQETKAKDARNVAEKR